MDKLNLTNNSRLMVCHECDALQNVAHIPWGETATCVCCGERLFKNTKSPIETPLALSFASLIFFLVANIYPIMQISIAGIERDTTLIGSAMVFFEQGNVILSIVVLLTSVLFPGFCLIALCYVLLSIQLNRCWRFTRPLLVWVSRLLPWGMMDVFMLGILVALVKLLSYAQVVLGLGFSAFVALVIAYAMVLSSIEMHVLWSRLDEALICKSGGAT